MPALQVGTPLTAEERIAKRKLILRDTVSLASLFLITAAMAALTYFLFDSFSQHRLELAQRWQRRGEAAMAAGHPDQAIEPLRAALEYQPERRQTEIDLATALAAAGRDEEAISYFNSLHELEPGNGPINLQLARLAAKQGNESQTVEYYQRALDGTWHGDGYVRRLTVRLELARYLIGRKEYQRARTQLLIAAGNAPDDVDKKMEIAGLMEEAQDTENAFEIYRVVAGRKPAPLKAVEGAGRMAFALGRFELAQQYLEKAVKDPGFAAQPEASTMVMSEMLAESKRLLELFPSPDLRVDERAARILYAARMARARLEDCAKTPEHETQLAALTAQWHELPATLKPRAVENDPELAEKVSRLAFDTEKEAAQVCGAPTGDDALLLKIAQAPEEVEQQ